MGFDLQEHNSSMDVNIGFYFGIHGIEFNPEGSLRWLWPSLSATLLSYCIIGCLTSERSDLISKQTIINLKI